MLSSAYLWAVKWASHPTIPFGWCVGETVLWYQVHFWTTLCSMFALVYYHGFCSSNILRCESWRPLPQNILFDFLTCHLTKGWTHKLLFGAYVQNNTWSKMAPSVVTIVWKRCTFSSVGSHFDWPLYSYLFHTSGIFDDSQKVKCKLCNFKYKTRCYHQSWPPVLSATTAWYCAIIPSRKGKRLRKVTLCLMTSTIPEFKVGIKGFLVKI